MSDDEFYGSDDDNVSPESTVSRMTFANDDQRRAHHNELERKRRDNIKTSFDSLREAVPSLDLDASKMSRAEILKRASEYIKSMRKRNYAHQQDIKHLETQNDDLERKIKTIQEASPSAAGGNISKRLHYDTESSNETDSGTSGDDAKLRKRIKAS